MLFALFPIKQGGYGSRAQKICEYAKFKGYATTANGGLDGFTDAGELSPWAQEAMQWVIGSGVMQGKGQGMLDPKAAAACTELAAMLHNF